MTELCNGTLHDLLVDNKDNYSKIITPYRLENVVLCQIVEGVKQLHENGIIHRDLKPRNILYRIISDEGGKRQFVMKVADFGCSRSVPDDMTHYTRTEIMSGYSKHFRQFGTDGWLAPEVLNGVTQLRPPQAVDIYPLGLIFAFTLCGGQHPYGDDATARDDRMKNKQPMLDIIRQQLIDAYGIKSHDLINRMIDSNPEKRPTPAEVLANKFFPPRPVIARDTEVRYEVTQII